MSIEVFIILAPQQDVDRHRLKSSFIIVKGDYIEFNTDSY